MDNALNLKYAKRAFWCYISISYMLSMLLPVYSAEGQAFNLIAAFAGAFIIFMCVHYDSKVIGRTLGPLFKVGLIFLAIVFVPIYIYQTRGFKKGTLTILKYVFMLIGVMLAGALLLYGLGVFGFYDLPA